MRRSRAVLVACAAVLAWPSALVAAPADAVVVLAPGAEKFLRPGVSVTGIAWEPAAALSVEVLPSDEVFVTASPGAKGEALLLVAGTDGAVVWRVCIGDPAKDCPKTRSIEEAAAHCPGLARGDDDGAKVWRVPVDSVQCLDALLAVLPHAEVRPGELRVALGEAVLTAYAARVEKALKADPATKALKVGLLGPLVRLEGDAPRETVARALLAAWRHVPGRLTYDDATKTLPSAPGAPKLFSPFIRIESAPAAAR